MNQYLDEEIFRQANAQTYVQAYRFTERQILKKIGIQTCRYIDG
jgi:hypothetical protein